MVSRSGAVALVVAVALASLAVAKDPEHARLVVHAHMVAAVVVRRGRLRLVAVDGIMVKESMMGERDDVAGQAGQLGEEEAERRLIDTLTDLHRRLDRRVPLFEEVSALRARLEHRQALREVGRGRETLG